MNCWEEILYSEAAETLAQVAWGSCRCPIPGSVQVQAEWGPEQPDLVEGAPAHGSGVRIRIFNIPANSNHSITYDSVFSSPEA